MIRDMLINHYHLSSIRLIKIEIDPICPFILPAGLVTYIPILQEKPPKM